MYVYRYRCSVVDETKARATGDYSRIRRASHVFFFSLAVVAEESRRVPGTSNRRALRFGRIGAAAAALEVVETFD